MKVGQLAMGEPQRGRTLPHLIVPWRPDDRPYRGHESGGKQPVRRFDDRSAHVRALAANLAAARDAAEQQSELVPEALRPDGFVLTVEGWSDEPGYALALTSLDTSGARLLSVVPATEEEPERAHVWMPYRAVERFLRKLDEFATAETRTGRPKNEKLVANIAAVRLAMLEQLWQEPEPFPDGEPRWWEVWFARLPEAPDPTEVVPHAAEQFALGLSRQMLSFPDRTVALVSGSPERLGLLLMTNAVVAELRRPRLVPDLFQLEVGIQRGYIEDLAQRIEPAGAAAPAVCLLDTGVMGRHRLLQPSVDGTYTVIADTTTADTHGHGTKMAGLALFGDLEDALDTNVPVRLRHRLESVKTVDPLHPHRNAEPELRGVVTARGTAAVEADRQRRRAFSLPITIRDGTTNGRPSSWSAAVDALAFGTDIGASDSGVELLGRPDLNASRLVVISAGNVRDDEVQGDYLDLCDSRQIEDPAQAWNAIVVGAYTERTDEPQGAIFAGHRPAASAGELSPCSRTSVSCGRTWAMRPDVVLEGGNRLIGPRGDLDDHESLQLLTTRNDGLLDTANGTSASAAQAARLAAVVWDRYPTLWPETVRGLIIHGAEWTPSMTKRLHAETSKTQRAAILCRYGWGVPTEERVLYSATNRATLLVEDEFQPFERRKGDVVMRALRLHELPWPRDQLFELFDADVRMRVTLSYFVEPNPSNRGWKAYRYPSHRLRFDVKRQAETFEEFRTRVSHEAQRDEEGRRPSRTTDRRWQIGSENRNRGSLHADIWTGRGADLAECDAIAVFPVGGWWKDNRRKDRSDLPVRYALLVSLHTDEVAADIYTPIATQIGIPVEIQA